MTNRLGLKTVSCLLWLFCLAPCLAGDASGWWTSSSGSKVHLWANMQQVVVTIQTPQGQKYKYQGYWTRFSDQFQYAAEGGTVRASFVGANQINVTDIDGRQYVWTRGASAARPKPRPAARGIDGLWASTTGSSVQLSSQGNQIFVSIIGAQGKRYQGSGRWTNYPHTFDYSIPGINGVAHCTMMTDGRIQVIYGGAPSYWRRH